MILFNKVNLKYIFFSAMCWYLLVVTDSSFSQSLTGLDPIKTSVTYNSVRPYGTNDDAIWAGRGATVSLTGGGWINGRFISLKIAPIVYSAQNSGYNSQSGNQSELGVDMPYRFGESSLTVIDPGESSAAVHVGWFEAGVYTSSMKWGPGIHQSLIIGNNSPGLRRIMTRSRVPIELPVRFGKVDYQIMWAFPKNSPIFRSQYDRFMSGFNLSYSPGFLDEITVGVTRIFQSYIVGGKITRSQLLDPFETFVKEKLPTQEAGDRINAGDQMASVYISYVSENHNGKVYGEYAREDHNWDLRDAYTNPQNSRGYLFGAQKWWGGSEQEHKRSLLLEFVNTSSANLRQVRFVTGLYVGVIPEGHTNEGQPLGAAIGPGATSAYLAYNQYEDWGRFGFSFEKVEIGEYTYFESRSHYQPIESDAHRVNLHYGVDASFNFRGFILEPRLMGIQYFNEGWDPDRDFWNWHLRLGVTYPFKARPDNKNPE